MKPTLALIILMLFCATLQAQDLESISRGAKLSLSGNLRLGTNFYHRSGEGPDRNAPFGYMLAGGLNIGYGEFQVPLAFSFSQQAGMFSNPFNQYGMSPYYRWAKLHLGHRTLNFSPYVFSGKAFLGVGIELRPGKFHFTAFTGKIRNVLALEDTYLAEGPIVLPSYQRSITGARVGVGGQKAGFELMGIRAQDDPSESNPEILLPPIENLVIGSRAFVRFFKVLTLEANISGSLLTSDLRAQGFSVPDELDRYRSVFDPNLSTRLSFAGDASLNYRRKGFNVGLQYRRIDPFYQSFGINFLQNDVENYTANLAVPLLKRKLRLQGSFGLQRDDLKGLKSFRSSRIIGSASASYTPGRRFNIMFRYSNYQHENQSGLIQVNDTLKFVTVTQNLFTGGRLEIFDKGSQSLNWNWTLFSNQVVNESGNPNSPDANFNGSGITTSLLYGLKDQGWSFGPMFNANRYEFFNRTQGRIGGGLMLSKSLFNRQVQVSGNLLYNSNRFNDESDGRHLNFALNATARLKGGHSFGLRWFMLDNAAQSSASFQELRGNFTYGYNFRGRRPNQ